MKITSSTDLDDLIASERYIYPRKISHNLDKSLYYLKIQEQDVNLSGALLWEKHRMI